MSTLEKLATYLRKISTTQSLSEAQREARLALELIAKGGKK